MSRQFVLARHKDVTGTSGTGIVAEGVVFEDGQAVLKWLRKPYSLVVFPSLKNLSVRHYSFDGCWSLMAFTENSPRSPEQIWSWIQTSLRADMPRASCFG